MTVDELMNHLVKYPGEARVIVTIAGDMVVAEKWYDIQPAQPPHDTDLDGDTVYLDTEGV